MLLLLGTDEFRDKAGKPVSLRLGSVFPWFHYNDVIDYVLTGYRYRRSRLNLDSNSVDGWELQIMAISAEVFGDYFYLRGEERAIYREALAKYQQQGNVGTKPTRRDVGDIVREDNFFGHNKHVLNFTADALVLPKAFPNIHESVHPDIPMRFLSGFTPNGMCPLGLSLGHTAESAGLPRFISACELGVTDEGQKTIVVETRAFTQDRLADKRRHSILDLISMIPAQRVDGQKWMRVGRAPPKRPQQRRAPAGSPFGAAQTISSASIRTAG